MRLSRAIILFGAALTTAGLISSAAPSAQVTSSLPSDAGRLREMQHHFLDVTLVHEAVIRGDLAAIREPATRLANMPTPTGASTASLPFLTGIGLAGRRAADARNLASAATATVSMLRQCGECHEASRVRPTPAPPTPRDLGGIVGHMLEHRRALDMLLQSLIVPSPTSWKTGVDALRVAALRPSEFPSDAKLTKEYREAETTVHDIAVRAASADTVAKRADTYAQLLATCATCHSLHRRIWGPGTGQ